ncbi:hypothetical protein MET9862_04837 [Methylobacterium symbioticum]|jgi:hypothetical protein|uniref:Uncharacterized protein n=1 Tax=Methylobacterium symbioticum TaxID=2584084 RepID=A0A509EL41_9HYPH|nr:hypothetical protein MET9862_04837 [Methylobacterium symbioticum]
MQPKQTPKALPTLTFAAILSKVLTKGCRNVSGSLEI